MMSRIEANAPATEILQSHTAPADNALVDTFFSPWVDRFLESVRSAQHEMLIVSPFIKLSMVRPFVAALSSEPGLTVRIVTRFNAAVFQQCSSDLSALALLQNDSLNRFHLFSLSRLHAKIYGFDRHHVFLGSSNFTISGLHRNLEAMAYLGSATLYERLLAELTEHGAFDREISKTELSQMRETISRSTSPLATIEAEQAPQVVGEDFASPVQLDSATPGLLDMLLPSEQTRLVEIDSTLFESIGLRLHFLCNHAPHSSRQPKRTSSNAAHFVKRLPVVILTAFVNLLELRSDLSAQHSKVQPCLFSLTKLGVTFFEVSDKQDFKLSTSESSVTP